MGSGCEILIAAKLPSSARQLPILAALHARASTLFAPIIHQGEKKVNTFLKNIVINLSKRPGSGKAAPRIGGCYLNLERGLVFS